MSAFTDKLQELLERELSATTEAAKRAIREEREEVLLANHRGEFTEEPKLQPPDVTAFDPRMAQAGRDE